MKEMDIVPRNIPTFMSPQIRSSNNALIRAAAAGTYPCLLIQPYAPTLLPSPPKCSPWSSSFHRSVVVSSFSSSLSFPFFILKTSKPSILNSLFKKIKPILFHTKVYYDIRHFSSVALFSHAFIKFFFSSKTTTEQL